MHELDGAQRLEKIIVLTVVSSRSVIRQGIQEKVAHFNFINFASRRIIRGSHTWRRGGQGSTGTRNLRCWK